MDQAVAYWQIYTIVRPQDSVRASENTVTLNTEHSGVAQSLPSLIVMTLRRLSSRRWLQSSEIFACPAWNEYLSCSANSKSTLAQKVTLVRKPRLTASRCWTSNGVSLQKRRPKAPTDDRPSTRKLLFSFNSRRSNRDTAPHRFDDANRHALCITFTPFGDRDLDIDDPTRTPPNPSAAVADLPQLQDRNFSSSVAKERLSNSFAFDSFVRKQASVGESKKRKKKTQVDFSRGVRSQPSNYAVYAPVLSRNKPSIKPSAAEAGKKYAFRCRMFFGSRSDNSRFYDSGFRAECNPEGLYSKEAFSVIWNASVPVSCLWYSWGPPIPANN